MTLDHDDEALGGTRDWDEKNRNQRQKFIVCEPSARKKRKTKKLIEKLNNRRVLSDERKEKNKEDLKGKKDTREK